MAVLNYVSVICHKRRSEMNEQIVALYELARQLSPTDFVVAIALATEQNVYGAEYLTAITSPSSVCVSGNGSGPPRFLSRWPVQKEVERALGEYEAFVANRGSLEEEKAKAKAGTQQ